MARTGVLVLVKNATFETSKLLTYGKTREIVDAVNDALDAVADLTFSFCLGKTSRDDDTPSA